MREDNQSPIISENLRQPTATRENRQFYIVDTMQFALSRPKLDKAIFQLRVGDKAGLQRWNDLLVAYSRTKLKSRKRGERCSLFCEQLGFYTGRDIARGLVQVDFTGTRENLRIFQSLVEDYFGYRGEFLQLRRAVYCSALEVAFDFYPDNPIDEDAGELSCIELASRIAWRMTPLRLINPYSETISSTHKNKHILENGIRTHYIQSCRRKDRDLPIEDMSYNPNASLRSKIYVKHVYDVGYLVRVEGTFSKYKQKKELPLNYDDFTILQDTASKIKIDELWKFIEIHKYEKFLHDFSNIVEQDPSLGYELIANKSENSCNKIITMQKVLRLAGHKRPSEVIMRYGRKLSFAEAINTPVPETASPAFREDAILHETNRAKKIKAREKIKNAMRKIKSA